MCGNWFEGMITSDMQSDLDVLCGSQFKGTSVMQSELDVLCMGTGLKKQLLVCNLTWMF